MSHQAQPDSFHFLCFILESIFETVSLLFGMGVQFHKGPQTVTDLHLLALPFSKKKTCLFPKTSNSPHPRLVSGYNLITELLFGAVSVHPSADIQKQNHFMFPS